MEKEITISQYINGELSGTALKQFEALLEKDTALQEEIQFHIEVEQALSIKKEVDSNKNLKSFLSDLGKTHIQNAPEKKPEQVAEDGGKEIIANTEFFDENKSILKKLNPYWLFAAAAALLLILFVPSLQKKTNPEIAANYFKPYQLNDEVMGDDDISVVYKNAKRNYAKDNFKEANNQFAVYLRAEPNAPKVWLAKGCADFKLDDFDAALYSFKKTIETDESGIYHANANWYLALCYLKKDNPEKTKHHLQNIQQGDDYFDEAQKLIRQLINMS